jgi:hypothetical protein
MDEFGCYRHTTEDAAEVAKQLNANGTVVFPYSYDQVGCMLVLISNNFAKLGVMPFGGNPDGRNYVGIFGRGCGHLSAENGPVESYVEEKLNLQGEDAKNFAEFYQWIVQHARGYN